MRPNYCSVDANGSLYSYSVRQLDEIGRSLISKDVDDRHSGAKLFRAALITSSDIQLQKTYKNVLNMLSK